MTTINSEWHDPTDPVVFLKKHKLQIRMKAAGHRGMDVDDYRQEVALTIVEKAHKFDSSRGSFAAYIFGSLEKRLLRMMDDALYSSVSLDADNLVGKLLNQQIESIAADTPISNSSDDFQPHSPLPGAGTLLQIADAISGSSANEYASKIGLSKRTVNLKLANAKSTATY